MTEYSDRDQHSTRGKIELEVRDRLAEMLYLQRDLQRRVPRMACDPAALTGQERVDYISKNFMAIIHELCELHDETDWKWWAAPTGEVNERLVLKEAVDLWHFVMNILWAGCGFTDPGKLSDAFMTEYTDKRLRNIARWIEEGYDGKSTKCPSCRRALDDGTVGIPADGDGPVTCVCGAEIPEAVWRSVRRTRSS